MLIKKHTLILSLVLTSTNLLMSADVQISAADEQNFISKANLIELIKGKDGATYAEIKRDILAKDLNTQAIVDYFDCQTITGKHFFNEAILLPISPQSPCRTVANRQKMIMALVNNPALKAQVQDLVLEMAKQEKLVIELFSETFKNSACPEANVLRQLKNQPDPVSKIFYQLIKFNESNTLYRAYSTGSTALTCAGAGAAVYLLPNTRDYTVTKLRAAVVAAYFGYLTGSDYQKAYKKRIRLHALTKLIDIAEKFEDLCVEYNLRAQFRLSGISDVGQELVDSLQVPRYSQAKSYLFSTPHVHTFMYYLYEKEGCLSEIFSCLAELDVYNAIATKIIASQNTANQLCFTKFIDNARPSIKAIGFWNVLVPNAVPNTIDDFNTSIVFSGANAGGKTTTVRSIFQNILLSQSFGVAAAEQFEMTAFDLIYTYLNVSDDLINGLSLFASEVKRAQEVIEKSRLIGTSGKLAFALDELFTGTGSEQGEECASQFVDKLATEFSTVLFVYPTHFNKLKANQNCAHYKVDTPVKLADGSLKYPFTISKGASYDNVALAIAQNAGLFA